MGALKAEFHEVIAGEHGVVEDLHQASSAAWDYWHALHVSMPVYRSREQNRLLDNAYAAAEAAKWRYDQAKAFAERQQWESYYESF
jgi:hypothetical protein